MIVIICISIAGAFAGLSGRMAFSSASGITTSTVERQPLESSAVIPTDYYTDELGWIENPTVLERGMKSFYDATGVWPYLYITDNVNGVTHPSNEEMDEFARTLYDELFEDEGHFLLVFHEYNSDGNYTTWYVCGAQAQTVMDQEACDILLDYVDAYYFSDRDDSQMFADAFQDAGERIMQVTKSPLPMILVAVAVVVVVIIAFTWWKKAKAQKNLEAQQTQDILNADLETFAEAKKDEELEDLENKYQ